jgi:hypothetical protein
MTHKTYEAFQLFLGCFALLMGIALLAVRTQTFDTRISDVDFRRLMVQEGIVHPVKGQYQYSGCGNAGTHNSAFTGERNGVRVSGVICEGLDKGFTIRYF